MADSLKVLLDKQPTWFFQASSVVLLIILLVFLYWAFKGAKNYAEAVNKENKLVKLLEERNLLQQEKNLHKAITEQMSVVLENSATFVTALNHFNPGDIVSNQIQTIIESLATDIKTVVGEKHRCGFWLADANNVNLTLVNGSAAFPYEYANNKTLDINHSIAGRCYRKKETLFISDVTKDADWTISDHPSSYSSLICIPVNSWGVITIDGKQKMTHNTVLIGQLYASIIEGFMNKFFLGQVMDISQTEAAASDELMDEGGDESGHEY